MEKLTHPCGHTTDLHDSAVQPDRFICPVCKMRWHIHQAPPVLNKAKDWAMPGKRTIVIDQQPQSLKQKILDLLAADQPSNYDCWEAAEESIFEELSEQEQEEYQNLEGSIVEEWYAHESDN